MDDAVPRRAVLRLVGAGLAAASGCLGGDSAGSASTPTGDRGAVYVSAEWDTVQAAAAADWNATRTAEEGPCGRTVVFERLPPDHEVTWRGTCNEGIVVEVADGTGERVLFLPLAPRMTTVDG